MEEDFDAKLDTYALQMEIKWKCLKVHIQLQVLNVILKKKKSKGKCKKSFCSVKNNGILHHKLETLENKRQSRCFSMSGVFEGKSDTELSFLFHFHVTARIASDLVSLQKVIQKCELPCGVISIWAYCNSTAIS